MTGLIQIAMIAVGILFLFGWCITISTSGILNWERRRHYSQRGGLARILLYAPLWIPSLLLIGAMLPGAFSMLGWLADHCGEASGAHRHHLCLAHPPHGATFNWWLVLAAFLMVVSVMIAISWRHVRTMDCTARQLKRISEKQDRDGISFYLLDRMAPMAFTLGVFQAGIFISRGLFNRLSKPTLQAVLAHEQAHLRRADNFWALLDHVMTFVLPKKQGQHLIAQILLAREQACDAVAVNQLRNQTVVEQAMLEMLTFDIKPVPGTAGMADTKLEARLNYLGSSIQAPKQRLWIMLGGAFCLGLGAGPVHHALESIITWLLH